MGIADSLKGLFRRADTGAAGPAVADPPQTPEGVTPITANPGVQESPQTTQTEVSDSVLDPPSVEGSGLNPTVEPELGSESETPASAREIPVSEPAVSTEEEVTVAKPISTETEEPAPTTEAAEGATSSPTASDTESQA